MMKKYLLRLLYVSISILCFYSCGNKGSNSPREQKKDFSTTLSAADTAFVLKQTRECMECLKMGKIEEAIDMLSMLSDTKISSLSEEAKQQLRKRCRLFPVLDYSLAYFSFIADTVNDVKYIVKFKEGTKNHKPNTIGFMFNPVKKDGQWHLTIKQATQEMSN